MATGGGGHEPPDRTARKENGDNKMDDQRESYLYTANDEGPYRIFIEIMDRTKSINKFSVGQMLRKLPRYRNYIEDMKYLGRKKIIIFISSWVQANLLVGERILNEQGYNAYVPRHLVCITGVVSGVDSDIDIEDIKQEIESNTPVVDVYRMNRWVHEKQRKEPSNRVSVTFRAKNLPEKIRIFGITAKVLPFVRRAEMCKNCHRYGHKMENCKSKSRCEKCSQIHDESATQCSNNVKCLHCRSSNHRTTDPGCPAREREAGIKRMMAKQNLTYVEARELVPTVLSSNKYELLATTEDFPTIPESFAKMTAGNYVQKQSASRNRTARNVTQNQENQAHSQNAWKRKKTDNEAVPNISYNLETSTQPSPSNQAKSKSESIRGTGLNNPHATTQAERMQEMLKKAQEEARTIAGRSAQENIMSFYSALLQIPEVTEEMKERIKDCSKKYLPLDQIIH